MRGPRMRAPLGLAVLGASLLAGGCRAETRPPAVSQGAPAAADLHGAGATASTPAPAGTPAADTVPLVRIAELLARRELVGRTVRVTGRCLGYGVVRAYGPPPRTRSDWQLASGDAAIWVTGQRPAECSATEGSAHDDTIIALVIEDTVRILSSDAGRPRRYLRRGTP